MTFLAKISSLKELEKLERERERDRKKESSPLLYCQLIAVMLHMHARLVVVGPTN